MNLSLTITCDTYPDLALRAAQAQDQSNLREWKNVHRHRFFFQDLISAEMQAAWFDSYLKRDQDFMFVVEVAGQAIGCMAIRRLVDTWDYYNIILGVPQFGGQGHMSQAFRMLCSFALDRAAIRVSGKVLKDNPAIEWYLRNAGRLVATQADYVELELDTMRFTPCAVRVSTIAAGL